MKQVVICHICDFQPEYGGAFVDALVHLNRYCVHKFNIGVFCVFPDNARNKNWLQKLDEEGVRYGFIPRQRNIVRNVRLLLQNYDPVILHTHFFLFDLSAILIKLLFYRTAKVVWHYHNPTEFTVKQRIKDAVKIRLCANSFGDRCIAVSDGVHKSLLDAGLVPEKAVLIHNAINASRFLGKCEVTPEARQKLRLSPEGTVFLLLGWDPARKGVDVFFRAAEALCRTKHTDGRFLVVGRKATRVFISKLLSQSQMRDDAFQMIDPVEDFSLLLKTVDVLVSASRSEGLTYAVLESMAAGKIVISSDIPSVRETYGRSKGVSIFPSEDWKMLAELMRKVLSLQSAERQSLGQANSRYVIENHSLDRWSEKVGQLYNDVIEGHKQALTQRFKDDQQRSPREVIP